MHTGVIFIDVKNAYNSVKVDILEEILTRKMISREDIRWIVGFLNNRSVEITSEEKKISRRISTGLPQGDVLSPLLFNIHTSDCHSLNQNKTKLIQYADDFAIIESGITAPATITKLQRTLNILHETLNSLNLKINISKTKIMQFPQKTTRSNIKIEDTYIQQVTSHRFLGIDIDNNLKFHSHIDNQTLIAQKKLNFIKAVCNRSRHINPEKTIQLHRSLIRGSLEYGISLSSNANKTKKKTN